MGHIGASANGPPILEENGYVAARAGLLKAQYGPSHGLGLADAIIAATVQAEECNLATLNVRQFPMLADLEPAYLKPEPGDRPDGGSQ